MTNIVARLSIARGKFAEKGVLVFANVLLMDLSEGCRIEVADFIEARDQGAGQAFESVDNFYFVKLFQLVLVDVLSVNLLWGFDNQILTFDFVALLQRFLHLG